MMRVHARSAALSILLAAGLLSARAASAAPAKPDFLVPPGMLNGKNFSPDAKPDLPVVFVFFCTECPSAKANLKKIDAQYAQYLRSGVRVVAVGSCVTSAELKEYFSANGIRNLEGLADPSGIMQSQLGFKISLNNIWQMCVWSTTGKATSYFADLNRFFKDHPEAPKTAAKAEPAPQAGAPELKGAYLQLAQKHPGKALALFRAHTRDKGDAGTEAQTMADKLEKEPTDSLAAFKTHADERAVEDYEAAKKLLAEWKDDAALRGKIEAFIKECSAKKEVKEELAARAMRMQVFSRVLANPSATLAAAKAGFAAIAKKYPKTPTGQQAEYIANLK